MGGGGPYDDGAEETASRGRSDGAAGSSIRVMTRLLGTRTSRLGFRRLLAEVGPDGDACRDGWRDDHGAGLMGRPLRVGVLTGVCRGNISPPPPPPPPPSPRRLVRSELEYDDRKGEGAPGVGGRVGPLWW